MSLFEHLSSLDLNNHSQPIQALLPKGVGSPVFFWKSDYMNVTCFLRGNLAFWCPNHTRLPNTSTVSSFSFTLCSFRTGWDYLGQGCLSHVYFRKQDNMFGTCFYRGKTPVWVVLGTVLSNRRNPLVAHSFSFRSILFTPTGWDLIWLTLISFRSLWHIWFEPGGSECVLSVLTYKSWTTFLWGKTAILVRNDTP